VHKPNNLQISDCGIVEKLIDAIILDCNKRQFGTILAHLRDRWLKSNSNIARFKENNKKFGLSSLHAWIRFFECSLHIGYKMTLKKWQARTVEDKSKVKAVKQQIQSRFKDEMGLIVDVPKSSGSGTSIFFFFFFKFFRCSKKS
jgi:hypothetical protein